MAAAGDVMKHLSCAICLSQFKEPKVLPCLHTYCKECLRTLLEKRGCDQLIKCPECRQEAKIIDGDVDKLQSNFWVNNFMTFLSIKDSTTAGKPLVCEHCDSGDLAVSRCTNCCVFMCEFCVAAHKRIHTFKNHQTLSLEEVIALGARAFVKPVFCGRHSGEPLKLFCQTCQTTICRDCTIVDHCEHKYDFVADVAEKEKEAIKHLLKETKAKECLVEKGLKDVKAMEMKVGVKIAQVSQDVDTFINKQMEALERARANLKEAVTMQGEAKVELLQIQRKSLSFSLACLKSSVDFTERALADGDDVELLSMKPQLVQRLSNLKSSVFNCEPCKDDYLRLKVHKNVSDIAWNIATVQHVDIPIDPDKCVVSMVGGEPRKMLDTCVGKRVDFVVVIYDEEGNKKTKGGCVVCAVVEYKRRSHGKKVEKKELLVQDNGEGSYRFAFQPEVSERMTLSVRVGGRSVRGSPFTWKVKPVQDQNTNNSSIWLMNQLRLVQDQTASLTFNM